MRDSSKIKHLAALALAAALVLTGCAQIPTQSGVSGRTLGEVDAGDVFFKATGPKKGATPQEIVDGYIFAQAAGLNDNWQVAREFLTEQASAKWNPTHGVSIYAGDVELTPTNAPPPEDDQAPTPHTTSTDPEKLTAISIDGRAKLSGTVDGGGHFTEAVAGSDFDQTYDLVRDSSGEWRIASVSEGIIMSISNFQSIYRSASIYFLSLDDQYLVPEVRWVPRVKSETYAIAALLAGPSPWLRDAVQTAIPDSTRLLYDSVSTEGGQAVVNLSTEVLSATSAQRTLVVSQIEATLTKLPGIRSVSIESNSIQIDSPSDPNLIRDPILASNPVVLQDNQLVTLNGHDVTPISERATLEGHDVTALAISDERAHGVFLDQHTSLWRIANVGKSPELLLEGGSLLAPSIDRFGWVWTGESRQVGNADGKLTVLTNPTTVGEVTAPWLSGRSIQALSVAHDGTRIAVVSTGSSGTQIDVAGITRDDKGAPSALSDPITVGGQVVQVSHLRWVDESTLAVVAQGASSDSTGLYSVPISGRSELIAPVDEVASLGVGRGLRSVYVGTEDDRVLTRSTSGSSWTELLTGARLPTFPG